ncbi:hypothetical protein MMIC_P1761 [Mariprofundus micogutta]|uniref:Transporter suffix domain-containing protein n=1 Tax=Mariprofundus micogutta TaxID=1921010 RepID=A0A1L8CPF8_9PROT|nr:transporter suffix domain-containing protein [Mariprofundus micogutta]GAV20787.1 hypothetical protein MMIC_P1761 [Mariprofundus micogutta]
MLKFKRVLGLSLFWASWILWAAMLFVPFVLDTDAATITIVVTTCLVVAEVSFIVSLFLLGKPFYQAFKARLKPYLFKLTARGPEKE